MTKKQKYNFDKKRLFDYLDHITKDREPHKIDLTEIDYLRDSMYCNNIKPGLLKNRIKKTKHICATNKDRLLHFLFRQKASYYVLFLKRPFERKDYKHLEEAAKYTHNAYVYDVLAVVGPGDEGPCMFHEGFEASAKAMGKWCSVYLDVGYPISEYWFKELFDQTFKRKNIYDIAINSYRIYAEVVDTMDLYNKYPEITVAPHLEYMAPFNFRIFETKTEIETAAVK